MKGFSCRVPVGERPSHFVKSTFALRAPKIWGLLQSLLKADIHGTCPGATPFRQKTCGLPPEAYLRFSLCNEVSKYSNNESANITFACYV